MRSIIAETKLHMNSLDALNDSTDDLGPRELNQNLIERIKSIDYWFRLNKEISVRVSLCLVPGFGGSQRLAKIIGRARAKELLYTARKVKANEAKDIGHIVRA